MSTPVPTTITPSAPDRRTLSPRIAFALVAAIIGLALFASGTPSPLYGTYRALWGFSPVVLTLVYATYAFGVLATLILAGRISDEVGRRPISSEIRPASSSAASTPNAYVAYTSVSTTGEKSHSSR